MTSTFKAHLSTLWTSSDATRATGGTTTGEWTAFGVSIDTRTLQPGDLYIAIKGEIHDGHDYVAEALAKGAAAAVVQFAPSGVDEARLLIVSDTLKAMEDLGSAARTRTAAKIIGVTGSVGKTGTKDMLGHALSVLGQTHWSEKSYNNHWGVPLSLSRMHAGTDYAVFEMGMNHAGEIERLSSQVRPHLAIITTIAPTHIEHFPDGIDGIARAKAEIFAGMDVNGIAVLNRDLPQFELLKSEAIRYGVKKIFTFGEHEQADARVLDTLVASNGIRLTAFILGEEITFTLRDSGLRPGRTKPEGFFERRSHVLFAVQ